MKKEIEEQMAKYEQYFLPGATKSQQSIRFNHVKKDIRPAFAKDADRILHSQCYTRYSGKTQVFSITYDDHISTRSTHVQFVSKTARTIARALGYNEDLCEAISLGHDIGHTAFGHVGEHILNAISKKEINQIFAHNVQSVRNVMFVENKGKGLNLSLQVLDGILCHNGEFIQQNYAPIPKTKEQFMEEYEACYRSEQFIKTLRPMTIEGCIVRISDMIAYVGKDLEDAEKLKLFTKKELDEQIVSVLGSTNSDIMNTLILDVIENSFKKPYIMLSSKRFEAIKNLKVFNYDKIYQHAEQQEDIMQYEKMFDTLYHIYLEALLKRDARNEIVNRYLVGMDEHYLKTDPRRIVIDYIAGMTNRYMFYQYEKYQKGEINHV